MDMILRKTEDLTIDDLQFVIDLSSENKAITLNSIEDNPNAKKIECICKPTKKLGDGPGSLSDESIVARAAHFGFIDIVKLTIDQADENTLYISVIHGHIEIIKLLKLHNHVFNESHFQIAVKCGHVETLNYFDSIGLRGNPIYSTTYAAENNQLESLKWLCTKGYSCYNITSESATKCGNVKMLQYLNGRCPIHNVCLDIAIQVNSVPCLKFLHQSLNKKINCDTFYDAAICGSLHCLWYIHKQHVGAPDRDKRIQMCGTVTKNKYFTVMWFLIEHDYISPHNRLECVWGSETPNKEMVHETEIYHSDIIIYVLTRVNKIKNNLFSFDDYEFVVCLLMKNLIMTTWFCRDIYIMGKI